jgi:hypothetical protein
MPLQLLGARELLPAEAAEAQAPLLRLGQLVQLRLLVRGQVFHAVCVWGFCVCFGGFEIRGSLCFVKICVGSGVES